MKTIIFSMLATLVSLKTLFVAEIVRSGITSPSTSLPFFPDISFPMLDELTPGGLRQIYLLGRLRRSQLIDTFLPFEFDPSKIHARAIEDRKSMMTAQAYLLGLYPTGLAKLNDAQDQHVWDILVPPIDLKVSENLIRLLGKNAVPNSIPLFPVRSVNFSNEKILQIEGCSYYNQATQSYFLSDGYRKIRGEFSETWAKIRAAYIDITENYLSTKNNSLIISEYLVASHLVGQRPSKVTKDTITELNNFSGLVLKRQFSEDLMLQKITMFGMVNELLERMNRTIEGKETPSFNLYVSHPHVMASMMLGMQTFNNSIGFDDIGFGHNIMIELTKEEGASEFYVTVQYNGRIVHQGLYPKFIENMLKIADIGTTWEAACKKTQ